MRIGKPAGVAALVLGLTVTGIGVGGLVLTRHSSPAARPAALTGTVPATVPATLPVTLPAPAGRIVAASPSVARPVAAPVSLDIPAIAVSTTLIRLGLTATGALQVPASTSVAGWYTGSSRPGAIGPAVIAGHIDSYTGPGVFYRLDELRPGDRVYIGRTDGTLAVFRVTSVRTYAKAGFPTQAVYGPAPDAELRLITCGGVFDASRGSYLSNVVVYAVATS
ncbi:MAG TPA: class F sortase [Streptosporangiaceae bacterium]|nr:class F sortase [Streptosporangiaceae bacterium]